VIRSSGMRAKRTGGCMGQEHTSANRGRPGAPQSKLHSTNMVAGAPCAVDNGLNGRLERFLARGPVLGCGCKEMASVHPDSRTVRLTGDPQDIGSPTRHFTCSVPYHTAQKQPHSAGPLCHTLRRKPSSHSCRSCFVGLSLLRSPVRLLSPRHTSSLVRCRRPLACTLPSLAQQKFSTIMRSPPLHTCSVKNRVATSAGTRG
jgi:hypothetical protein